MFEKPDELMPQSPPARPTHVRPPASPTGAWSAAASMEGHRQCRFCGAFVRDNGDLDTHCCSEGKD